MLPADLIAQNPLTRCFISNPAYRSRYLLTFGELIPIEPTYRQMTEDMKNDTRWIIETDD